jgi:SpoVK/Ycf46/Vps4 family AAA+-type ATPase
MSLQRGINLKALAEKMGQCSGAEVRGICTEAGMYALRERRQHVTQEDFEFAVAKVCVLITGQSACSLTEICRSLRRTRKETLQSTSYSHDHSLMLSVCFL